MYISSSKQFRLLETQRGPNKSKHAISSIFTSVTNAHALSSVQKIAVTLAHGGLWFHNRKLVAANDGMTTVYVITTNNVIFCPLLME